MLAYRSHGTEAAGIAATEMQALRTAIADAVGPKSRRRSVDLVMVMHSHHGHIDPQVQHFVRKILLLRRTIAKYPHYTTTVRAIASAHKLARSHGTGPTLGSVYDKQPAVGPVSQLLRYLHKYGATLTIDLTIQKEAEMPIHLLTDPWQTLQVKAAELATQARGQMTAQRRCMGGQADIDTAILYAA